MQKYGRLPAGQNEFYVISVDNGSTCTCNHGAKPLLKFIHSLLLSTTHPTTDRQTGPTDRPTTTTTPHHHHHHHSSTDYHIRKLLVLDRTGDIYVRNQGMSECMDAHLSHQCGWRRGYIHTYIHTYIRLCLPRERHQAGCIYVGDSLGRYVAPPHPPDGLKQKGPPCPPTARPTGALPLPPVFPPKASAETNELISFAVLLLPPPDAATVSSARSSSHAFGMKKQTLALVLAWAACAQPGTLALHAYGHAYSRPNDFSTAQYAALAADFEVFTVEKEHAKAVYGNASRPAPFNSNSIAASVGTARNIKAVNSSVKVLMYWNAALHFNFYECEADVQPSWLSPKQHKPPE